MIGYGAPNLQGIGKGAWRAAGRGRDRRAPGTISAGRIRPSRCPARSSRPGAQSPDAERRRGAPGRCGWRIAAARGIRDRDPLATAATAVFEAIEAFRKRAFRQVDRGRHPQGIGNGAGRDQRRDGSDGRRLGRPHPFEPDDHRGMGRIAPGDFGGRYIHYGIREHGMAAAMNGIALHGGFVPYGGTFLCLRRLCARRHPALRADGPARHLCDDARFDRARRGRADAPAGRASCDAESDAEPQRVPALRTWSRRRNAGSWRCRSAIVRACWCCRARACRCCGRSMRRKTVRPRAPIVMREAAGQRDVTLIATGSEVEIARAAADLLHARHGLDAAVVSMPCWELFEQQDEAYRAGVLGSAPRVAVEAAARLGWDRWIGERRRFRRHERLRRQRAGGRSLQAFRHHAGRRRRRRAETCRREAGMTLELARPVDMLAEKTVLLRADLDGGVTPELGLARSPRSPAAARGSRSFPVSARRAASSTRRSACCAFASR